jgi:hypothetical protein
MRSDIHYGTSRELQEGLIGIKAVCVTIKLDDAACQTKIEIMAQFVHLMNSYQIRDDSQ